VAFLASERVAGNISGATFTVDGGYSTELHWTRQPITMRKYCPATKPRNGTLLAEQPATVDGVAECSPPSRTADQVAE